MLLRRLVASLFSALFVLSSHLLASAEPNAPDSFLFKDINTTTASTRIGYLDSFIGFNDKLVFMAIDDLNNYGLWQSDGTEAGTQLIKVIVPDVIDSNGSQSAYVNTIASTADRIYVTIYQPYNKLNVLYQSDGTTAGTVQVTGVFSNEVILATTSSYLYFLATESEHGGELWRTDGTKEGTIRLTDSIGNIEFDYKAIWSAANTLYYSRDGYLWKSDGTIAGTTRVKDLSVPNSTYGAYIQDLREINGSVYFTTFHTIENAEVNPGVVELWRTNGSVEGTIRIKQIALSALFSPPNLESTNTILGVYNSTSFFLLLEHIGQVWKSDGTEAGTQLLHSYPPGDSYQYLAHFTISDGANFYFLKGEQNGYTVLWKTDGTVGGDSLVYPYNVDVSWFTSKPIVAVVNGRLIFSAYKPGSFVSDLFQTDGTPLNTKPLFDGDAFQTVRSHSIVADDLVVVNNMLFTTGVDAEHGKELWRSDGTNEGTRMVKDISNHKTESACPRDFTQLGDQVYFIADNGGIDAQLWKTDGTPEQTQLVQSSLDPTHTVNRILGGAGQTIYFVRDFDDISCCDPSIWATDGIVSATALISATSILNNLSYLPSGHEPYVTYNDNFYMLLNDSADSSSGGSTLWRFNNLSMTRLKYFSGAINTANQQGMKSVGGLLYFNANNGEMWRTDGTADGTIMLLSYPYEGIVSFLGKTYFTSANALWVTDGSEAGTLKIKDIPSATKIVATDDSIYLIGKAANYRNHIRESSELWKSDGTENGTLLFSNLSKPDQSTIGKGLYAQGKNVYFHIYIKDTSLNELWVSDGSADSFTRVHSALDDSTKYTVLPFDQQLFFIVTSNLIKQPLLWRSDGTVEGTYVADDLAKHIYDHSKCFGQLFVMHNKLFYTRRDEAHGVELWLYALLKERNYLPLIQR